MEQNSSSLDLWLVPPEEKKRKKFQLPERLTKKYMENNIQDVLFLALLVVVTSALFFVRCCQFINVKGLDGRVCWPLVLARGTGMAIQRRSKRTGASNWLFQAL